MLVVHTDFCKSGFYLGLSPKDHQNPFNTEKIVKQLFAYWLFNQIT